jgi:hypothetical protein
VTIPNGIGPRGLRAFAGRRGVHDARLRILRASALPEIRASGLVRDRTDSNYPAFGAIEDGVRVATKRKQVSTVDSGRTQPRKLDQEASLLFEPVYEVASDSRTCIAQVEVDGLSQLDLRLRR